MPRHTDIYDVQSAGVYPSKRQGFTDRYTYYITRLKLD